jgi:hypothetical protein
MAKYLILSDEVTGVKSSRHFKGQLVDGALFVDGSIPGLVQIGAIEKEAEKVSKEKKDKE